MSAVLPPPATPVPSIIGEESYSWSFYAPDGQTRGCRDSCQGGTTVPTALVTALTLTMLTHIALKLIASWKVQLAEEAVNKVRKEYIKEKDIDGSANLPRHQQEEEKKFVKYQASLAMIGAPFWAVLGPVVLCMAIEFEGRYPYNDPLNFQADISLMDKEDLRIHNQAVFMGELFLGYIIYQCIAFWQGFDKGMSTAVHHIAFLLVAWIQVSYGVLTRVGLWAISMELSTPPLLIWMVCRTVDSERFQCIGKYSSYVFATLFFIVRIFGFGYALACLLEGCIFAWYDVLPSDYKSETGGEIPRHVGVLLMGLLMGGYLLQLYWAKKIWAKCFAAEEKKEEDYGAVLEEPNTV